MNVKIRKVFGREITIQDEELVMPKYAKIKGVVKEPSWLELLKLFILYLLSIHLFYSHFIFIGVLKTNIK